MMIGSCSSALNARGMGMKKKSKDQGHLIVERNTPEVETAWMGYTDESCCGDKVGHGALPT